MKQSVTKEWNDVFGKYCPRFGMGRAVYVPIYAHGQALVTEDEVKMAFAFDGEKFITPYLLINDGQGNVLEHIEFTFTYNGDDLIDVRWKTHYSSEDEEDEEKNRLLRKDRTKVRIRYQWEHFAETDINGGLGSFLFIGFIAGLSMMIYVILDIQMQSYKFFKDTRKAQQEYTSPIQPTETQKDFATVDRNRTIVEQETEVTSNPVSEITTAEISSSKDD